MCMKNDSFSTRSSRAHRRAPFRLSRRSSIRLVLVVASLPLLAALVRWLRDDEANVALTNEGLRPALEAIGAQSIIVRDNGRKVWEFSADRITWSADHRFATVTNLRRGVLFRDGKPFLQMSATSVILNQETRNWQATGHLQASGPHGFSISTNRATWSHVRERLSCPDAVSAKLRDMRIETRAVVYEAKSAQLKCSQPVKVRSAQVTILGRPDVIVDTRTRRVEFRSGVDITVKRSALDAMLAKSNSQSEPDVNAAGSTSSSLRPGR